MTSEIPRPQTTRWRRWRRFVLVIALGGLVLQTIPQSLQIPVAGASARDWHPKSFWFYPWGLSGVHRGIDIFAVRGRSVVAASPGLVLFSGEIERGGKVVLVLSRRLHLHYYAHLDTINTSALAWVAGGERLGTVGDSGNARGKPPHLHYSIVTLLPHPWRMDDAPRGWEKMFYLDPGAALADKTI